MASWTSVEERHDRVRAEHALGTQIVKIAEILGVNEKTIRRDFADLSLTRWSNISDEALKTLVLQIIATEHGAVGVTNVESSLVELGHCVQRSRITETLVAVGDARSPPRQVKRRKYYATKGPDFVWVMDQNEKVGMYGFKILAIIDGFSRYPVYWKVVTNLRGRTHSGFFSEAVAYAGGAPENVSVDMAAAWNGVKEQVALIHGNPDEVSLVEIAGEFCGVRRFNQTSSVHQSPVERHWRDVNMVTRKWKEEFEMLEALGCLDIGDGGDLFSLVSVYRDAFVHDVDAHYRAMRLRKKRKDTLDPNYPTGTHRRRELYMNWPSLLTCLEPAQLQQVADAGVAYWDSRANTDSPLGAEVDPLQSHADRVARSVALDALQPMSLAETYVAHRNYTITRLDDLSNTQAALASASAAASDAIQELVTRVAAIRMPGP